MFKTTFSSFLETKTKYSQGTAEKACEKAPALQRLRKFIPKDVRLYKAYVLPHLEYCSPLLLGIGSAETTKMKNTNYS